MLMPLSIDSRGFIFGSAIANQIKKPLILARKKKINYPVCLSKKITV